MRAFKKFSKRGFTLVELMIVVAIIGVLAALAIFGVRRYLASAKTSEAKNTIGSIVRGASGAYEREVVAAQMLTEGTTSSQSGHTLCSGASTVAVPATVVPAGTKYQPITAAGSDFETGDSTAGWKCLRFSMSQAMYYRYTYFSGAGTHVGSIAYVSSGFEAGAQGDLDGNGTYSTFSRGGNINTATNNLIVATQVDIVNEYE